MNLLGELSGEAGVEQKLIKRQTIYAVLASFLLCLALTGWLWQNAREDARQVAEGRFEFQTLGIEQALHQRLEAYHQVLRGGAGLFAASDQVTREDWRRYVNRLRLDQNYPGIQGVGFARWIKPDERQQVIESVRGEGFPAFTIWPAGEREAYTSIIYLEPFDWRNQRAFGYDMYSEPNRRRAMTRARDEGRAVASDVVVLVQETDFGVQYGFNLYLPVYSGELAPTTVAERRQRFVGFVYSPFRIADLMQGVLSPEQVEDVRLQILELPDNTDAALSDPIGTEIEFSDSQIYDSIAAEPAETDNPPMLVKREVFEHNGQRWLLQFSSRPSFEASFSPAESRFLLLGGLLISTLFAAIVWFWGVNRVRAKVLIHVNQDLQQALQDRRQAEQNLERLFELAPDILCVLSRQGELTQVNPAFRQLLGYDLGELGRRHFADLFHDEDRGEVEQAILDVGDEQRVLTRLELRCKRQQGGDCWIEWSFVSAAREGFLYAFGRDVTARRESELSRRRLAAVLEGTADVIFFTDPSGRLLYLNGKGCEVFASEREPQGLSAYDLAAEGARLELREVAFPAAAQNGLWRGESSIVAADGKEVPVSLTIEAQFGSNGRVEFFSGIMHDISERKAYEDKLHYQASHDALTGLVNRREFEARLARAMEATTTRHAEHALLYIDLDHFKVVNDACGHEAGDELLRQLAALFGDQIRDRDTLARLGGDEFGLFMENCTARDALRIANKILAATKAFNFPCKGQVYRVGTSIGLVPISMENNSLKQVLNQADNACYIAKEGGRNRVVVHQVGAENVMQRREEMNWASRLNAALQDEHFRLFFQPIVPAVAEETGSHWEILLRLQDEDGSLISPSAFLSSAERFGLMPAIDRWVVSRTLEYLARNPQASAALNTCTINVSAKALSDEHFYQFVEEHLDASGLDPALICFEITETAAIGNLQTTLSFIRRLKERGVRFALDDFGTGMASFSYLKLLPVDYLKIDGSFVETIEHSRADYEMVRSINEIGHIMGMKTIAEFVSSQGIQDRLQEIGVDCLQGYHIARPQRLLEPAPVEPA